MRQPRHKKQPNAAAFEALCKGLVDAKQLFETGSTGGREGAIHPVYDAKQLFETGSNEGREGVIHALESVLKFLEKSPVGRRGLLAPLVALFDALMNLDDGEVRPILKKARVKGRGRASAMRESVKGVVAFTVHALHATGLPLPSARKLVARVLQKEGVTAERGRDPQVTARTVRGWCEHVDADVSRRGSADVRFVETKFFVRTWC